MVRTRRRPAPAPFELLLLSQKPGRGAWRVRAHRVDLNPRARPRACPPAPQSKLPPDAAACAPVIRQLLDHEHGWIFAEPVDTKSWPDYTKARTPPPRTPAQARASNPRARGGASPRAAFAALLDPPLCPAPEAPPLHCAKQRQPAVREAPHGPRDGEEAPPPGPLQQPRRAGVIRGGRPPRLRQRCAKAAAEERGGISPRRSGGCGLSPSPSEEGRLNPPRQPIHRRRLLQRSCTTRTGRR